jgi:hypothetical protein
MHEIWWEVRFANGLVVSQQRGASYEHLDRVHLKSFLIRDRDGPVVELIAEQGRTGNNLVYRCRTVMLGGIQTEVVLAGWIPQGPIYVVDPEALQVYESETFLYGDPVFYPPMPMLFENWVADHPSAILKPAFERID